MAKETEIQKSNVPKVRELYKVRETEFGYIGTDL